MLAVSVEGNKSIQDIILTLCSDIHQLDNGWGSSIFPMCPGHEIIGEVISTGTAVKKLKVGDRVGIGAQRDSCGTCDLCKRGEENICKKVSHNLSKQLLNNK